LASVNNIEIIDQCFVPGDLDNYPRQAFINRLIIKSFKKSGTEEQAMGMFFWQTADLEPPISNKELLYFRALGRMYYEYGGIEIKNMETVFDILNISKEKQHWPRQDLVREAKKAYWRQYNELTRDLGHLLLNAREIVMKKKAFRFLCG